jgi:hypothetical protein
MLYILMYPVLILTHVPDFLDTSGMGVTSTLTEKKKVLFILGATGTGKTKLSINLGTQFPSVIINSDKIQVYKGLDIVTNKVKESERCSIPPSYIRHHR